MIAPDGNRSAIGALDHDAPAAVGRGGRLRGRHGRLRDRRHAGRLRALRDARAGRGLHGRPVVSGINHGSNLGDDITYSGTVAAAFEGARARRCRRSPSRSSRRRARWTSASGAAFDFEAAARVHRAHRRGARGRAAARRARCSTSTSPAASPTGVEVDAARQAHLPRRAEARRRGRRRPAPATGSTATDPDYHDEPGTDLAAVAAGRIAVTPIHFDLTDVDGHRRARRPTTSRGCWRRRPGELE